MSTTRALQCLASRWQNDTVLLPLFLFLLAVVARLDDSTRNAHVVSALPQPHGGSQ